MPHARRGTFFRRKTLLETTPPRVRPALVAIPLIFFAVLGYLGIFSGIPATVVTPKNFDEARVVWTRVFPQGWAFFSKSQRDPLIAPYSLNEQGTAISLSKLPSTQADYLWGMSRNARAQGVEVALYASKLPSGSWKECSSFIIDECIRQNSQMKAVKVDNPTPSPSICGESYIVESEPVAWSYRHLTDQKQKALQVAKVGVECIR